MRLTEVYLFQCDGGELYAFSVAKTDCNLPQSACNGGWLLRGQLTAADLIDAQYAGALTGTAERILYPHPNAIELAAEQSIIAWNLLCCFEFPG
jgi:hypothetical protein